MPKKPTQTRDSLKHDFYALCEQQSLNPEVFSDGPLNATIAIVGEGPGETEIRQRLPFVGGSGKLLWDSLRRYGLNRTNVYSTNVVKRQISLSRTGNERNIVHRDELEKWTGLLRWELSQLPNLRAVFVLGNYALEALTSETGITNWRGSVLSNYKLPNNQTGHVVITINPAYAMRDLKFEPIFQMDCHKLQLVHTNKFRPYEIETLINPSYAEAMRTFM